MARVLSIYDGRLARNRLGRGARTHGANYELRHDAHRELARALAAGEIERPEACEECEETPANHSLHGHHADYSQPLAVEWLCARCHGLAHQRTPA